MRPADIAFASKKFNELTAPELYEILKARAEIFVVEQKINYRDMDDVDYRSLHCFFREKERVGAYLRAYYRDGGSDTVQIGRVLTLKHGEGLGRRLMENSINVIKSKMPCSRICMDAQKHAVGFYEKFGFRPASDEFLEEGIIHIAMELEL
ncbi:MAG: GNAT family N-acetyltransferase [Butyrivibrio sp.]|nr:GNAT family N-acetyltransferase [Butyrivibrio sp.]